MKPQQTKDKKPFVFVLMSFSPNFRDIYEVGIKAACLEIGVDCARADEQIFLEQIHERVYAQIAKADLVIAEMSGGNPNVFYETGYAHALKKRVILLTGDANDIPFDLKPFPHIVYQKSIADLKLQLVRKLRVLIDDPAEETRPGKASFDVDFDLMSTHILNHLRRKNFTMISFEKIREFINPKYSDELLWQLIERSPDTFRRATLSRGRPGIARLNE